MENGRGKLIQLFLDIYPAISGYLSCWFLSSYFWINILNRIQELKSLNTSASSIKYVAKKEYVANKLFVANQVFIGNHVFVWKISWKIFGSDQSSFCLKDQLTILRHHISERSKDTTLAWPVKYLFERSIDNTSDRANQAFIKKISWQYFG